MFKKTILFIYFFFCVIFSREEITEMEIKICCLVLLYIDILVQVSSVFGTHVFQSARI